METVELSVDGMTCGSCVQAARRALSRIPGVESVDVRLQEGAATVRGEGVATQAQALVGALADAGYAARVAPATGATPPRATAGGCGSGRSSSGCCCGR
ncbi:heavy metal-associated domain-containing protein [Ramlibacter sp. AN1015]|uniref:heavy-metal-associated domain-containing protein n=1 Tax=Ramlibacter sp. AN1015 TaxID=3133428 RepID=UPI0030C4E250